MLLTAGKLPALLSDLPKPPRALFLRGELPRGPAIAIVGTRAPSPEALEFTHRLAADLASAGVAILSGGARGIDTAAHRGALSVAGTTVVMAPAGFEQPYPPENKDLFQEVVERAGAYVSLVPDDQPARRHAFFARNACLAALCQALVLVQCGLRSGARNAVSQARSMGRCIFVVPSCPWVSRGGGCLEELRRGAHVCASAKDVLAWLRSTGHQPVSLRENSSADADSAQLLLPHLLPGPGSLLALVKEGVTHLDELSRKTGLGVGALQAQLLDLCLDGSLVVNPDGTYRVPA